ncbi:Ribonucleotide reductase of class Ia (aerobic)alpha subunit [Salmonella bongori]|nr:Ribonucleotide reductase of class Ia (aerobic)alpha subunit [Salmonella bongori]
MLTMKNGEIALCTLSAFNLGAIKTLDELEELAILAVRALGCSARLSGLPDSGRQTRRNGPSYGWALAVINFAYWLAKNGKRYSDGSANNLTHKNLRSHSVLSA